MNSSFYPANVSTSVPSKPKELVFYVKGLAMSAMARVSDSVDAVSKDLRVTVVDSGGGMEEGRVMLSDIKDLYHR